MDYEVSCYVVVCISTADLLTMRVWERSTQKIGPSVTAMFAQPLLDDRYSTINTYTLATFLTEPHQILDGE